MSWDLSNVSGCSGSRAAAQCSAALNAIRARFSISFWAYRYANVSSSQDSVMVAGKVIGSSAGFHAMIGNVPFGTEYTGLQFLTFHTGGLQAGKIIPSQGTFFSLNTWTHIVCVCDCGTLRVYRNGELYTGSMLFNQDQTGVILADHSARDLGVAKRSGVAQVSRAFVEISDVAIFDEVLSAFTIRAMYDGKVSVDTLLKMGLTTAGPVCAYRCDVSSNSIDIGRDASNTLTLANINQGTQSLDVCSFGGTNNRVVVSASEDKLGFLQTVENETQTGNISLPHMTGYPFSISYVMRIEPESEFWWSGKLLASPWLYRQAARAVEGVEGNVSSLCTSSFNTHQPCLRFLYRPDLSDTDRKVLQAYLIWGQAGNMQQSSINFFNSYYGVRGWWHAAVAQEAHIFTNHYIQTGVSYYVEHQYYADGGYHHAQIWIDGTEIFSGSFPNMAPYTLIDWNFGVPIVQYAPSGRTEDTIGVISHVQASATQTRYTAPTGLFSRATPLPINVIHGPRISLTVPTAVNAG